MLLAAFLLTSDAVTYKLRVTYGAADCISAVVRVEGTLEACAPTTVPLNCSNFGTGLSSSAANTCVTVATAGELPALVAGYIFRARYSSLDCTGTPEYFEASPSGACIVSFFPSLAS